jgi:2-polyprenyl-3-methyl-5-hydroxy-6-metoxy-1,4-benzoquinol methylase
MPPSPNPLYPSRIRMTSHSDNPDAKKRDEAVQAQYEALPYPARDPRDEAKRLVIGSPSQLIEIDHYLFAGKRDWSRPFHALIAGGGTGDACIMLAQQLADQGCPAEVHYLDLSRAARQVAEARAKARSLTNVVFHTGSLLDAGALGIGKVDYIDCTGVLHHLEAPEAGMRALADMLAEDGGIGVMVYGVLGRTGVYAMQEALRQLAPVTLPPAERVKIARRVLDAVPQTNWFKRNPFLGDHVQGGDAGLFDLLLHARDRAYDVAGFAALAQSAGLAIATFIEPVRYQPETYLADPGLRKRFADLPFLERAILAEQLAGNLTKHTAYLTWPRRLPACIAQPEGPQTIPLLREIDAAAVATAAAKTGALSGDLDGVKWRAALPPLASAILSRIDGKRSLGQIHAELQALDASLGWERFKQQFDLLYVVFNAANRVLLRA